MCVCVCVGGIDEKGHRAAMETREPYDSTGGSFIADAWGKNCEIAVLACLHTFLLPVAAAA